VKVKLDENIPVSLVEALALLGHDVQTRPASLPSPIFWLPRSLCGNRFVWLIATQLNRQRCETWLAKMARLYRTLRVFGELRPFAVKIVLPKVLLSTCILASPMSCKLLIINDNGLRWTSKIETSVLSVELRGRLIMNDL
jgi:hypothetical protein